VIAPPTIDQAFRDMIASMHRMAEEARVLRASLRGITVEQLNAEEGI
jgi:hypothetical protein